MLTRISGDADDDVLFVLVVRWVSAPVVSALVVSALVGSLPVLAVSPGGVVRTRLRVLRAGPVALLWLAVALLSRVDAAANTCVIACAACVVAVDA